MISSFYLVPSDGDPLPEFKPGQYICLILQVDGQTVRRNYSLSDGPGQDHLRISVKRETGGTVSPYLHDHLCEGDTVRLTAPSGDFVLNDKPRPLVLLSGGVGITPTLSMLKPALESGREMHFLHGALNSEHHAFRAQVQTLKEQHSTLTVTYVYSHPLPQDSDQQQGFFDAARPGCAVGQPALRILWPA